MKEARDQFAGALEAIDRLERDSEADAEQINSLKERVAELEASLLRVSNESAGYRATAEQLGQQIKAQEAQLERQHSELEGERKRWGQEMDNLKSSLTEAQDLARQQEKERAEAVSRLEETTKQLAKAEDRSERDTAITEAAELRGQTESLKERHRMLSCSASWRLRCRLGCRSE